MCSASSLLLLVLDTFHVVLGHFRIVLHHIIIYVVAQVPLHGNLLASAGHLGHTTARSELLAEVLGDLLDVQSKGFQSLHSRHVFALIALDAFDEHFGAGACLGGAGFSGGSFGGFLLRVFFSTFLGVEGQGGEVLFYCFCML